PARRCAHAAGVPRLRQDFLPAALLRRHAAGQNSQRTQVCHHARTVRARHPPRHRARCSDRRYTSARLAVGARLALVSLDCRAPYGGDARDRMNLKLKRTPGVYLVGFMASGKSTVGRHLARRMGWSFFDTDEEIASAEGVTIAEIFDTRGEEEFRRIEAQIIR